MFHVKILRCLGSFTVLHKFLQEKELTVSLSGVPCGHLKFKRVVSRSCTQKDGVTTWT